MTIIDLYTQRLAALAVRISNIKTSVSDARFHLQEQKKEFSKWTARAKQIETEIEKNELNLLKAETGADLEAIAASIRELRVHQRVSLGRMHDSHLAVQSSKASVATLVNNLEQSSMDLKQAEENFQIATVQHEKRLEWFNKLSTPPFNTISTDVDDVLIDPIALAIVRLNDETSEEFMDLVKLRVNNYWEQVDSLHSTAKTQQDSWNANLIAQHGFSANIENKNHTLDLALSALANYLANASSTLSNAENKARKILDEPLLSAAQQTRFSTLLAEGDIELDVFTPEENMRLSEHNLLIRKRDLAVARATVLADDPDISEADLNAVTEVADIINDIVTLQAAYDAAVGATGLPSYDTVLDKEQLLTDAGKALDLAIKEFLLLDPDGDPDSEPSLDAHRDAVSDAETEHEDAITALQATAWYKMEELEVVIPNTSWQDILDLLKAERDLTQLKSVALIDHVNAVTIADDELAALLAADLDMTDGYDHVADIVDEFKHSATQILARSSDAVFGAVRGLI